MSRIQIHVYTLKIGQQEKRKPRVLDFLQKYWQKKVILSSHLTIRERGRLVSDWEICVTITIYATRPKMEIVSPNYKFPISIYFVYGDYKFIKAH